MFNTIEKDRMKLLVWVLTSILIVNIVENFVEIKIAVSAILEVIYPFLVGAIIAYVMGKTGGYFKRRFNIEKGLSLFIFITIMGVIISVISIVAIPKTLVSIRSVIEKMPVFIDAFNEWYVNKIGETLNSNEQKIIQNVVDTIYWKVNTGLNGMFNSILEILLNFSSRIYKIVLGLILSIYMYIDSEKISSNISELSKKHIPSKKRKQILTELKKIDEVFSKYFLAKILDSAIIGVIGFIGISFLGTKNAIVLAFIMFITNMIPYFGPFIGGAPVVLATLLTNSSMTLWSVVLVITVQQFDGLYLGPKLLGGNTGISPLLVLSSIIIFGSLFGILGMVMAVPIVAYLASQK